MFFRHKNRRFERVKPPAHLPEGAAVFRHRAASIGLRPRERFLAVGYVSVPPELRRKGVATALYEVALEHACREKRQLASDVERSHFAEAFWRKQVRKGRARCLRRGDGIIWDGPLQTEIDSIERACEGDERCLKQRLAMLSRGLPKPSRNGTWPCRRWAFKRRICASTPVDLSGLR